MSDDLTHYELLEVDPEAPKDEIRTAYQAKLANVRAARDTEEETKKPSETVIRVAQDLPGGAEAGLLVARRPDHGLRGSPRLRFLVTRGAHVRELRLVGGADLLLRRVRVDLEQLVVGEVVAHGSRPRTASTRPSMGTRAWPMLSRSRTVTALSSSVSKSMVTHHGVPTSS